MKKFSHAPYQDLLESVGGVTSENLFIALGKVQDTFGYVPTEVVSDLAAKTGVAEARIYGALTCYDDFKVGLETDSQNEGN